jgi:hypothetical protein
MNPAMNDVKENLPIITVALLVSGATWLVSYYDYFGINITDYLDFSEIFQLQFLLFIGVMLIVISGIAQGLSMRGYMETKEINFHSKRRFIQIRQAASKNKFIDKYIYELLFIRLGDASKHKRKRKDNRMFFGKPLLMLIIITLVVTSLLQIHKYIEVDSYDKQMVKDIILLITLIIVYVFIANGILYLIKEKTERSNNRFRASAILVYLVFIGYGVIHTRGNAYNTLHDKPEYELTLLLKDKPIHSDTTLISTSKTIVYTGQTKNYLFLYNRNEKTAHIIPREQIVDLQTTKIEYKNGLRVLPIK